MSEGEEEERKSLIREKSTKLARGRSRKHQSSSKDLDTNNKTSKISTEKDQTNFKHTGTTEDERKPHQRKKKQGHSQEDEKTRTKEKREKQRRSKSKDGHNQSSDEIKSKRRRRRSSKTEKSKSIERQRHPVGEKHTKTKARKTKTEEDTKAGDREGISQAATNPKLKSNKEKDTLSQEKGDLEKNKSSADEAEIEESDMEKRGGTKTMFRSKSKPKDMQKPPPKKIEKDIPHHETNGEKIRHVPKVEQPSKKDFGNSSNAQVVVDDDILIGCAPYKQSVINKILKEAQNPEHPTKYGDIVLKLTEYGVTVYEIGYHATLDGGNLLGEVQGVAEEVSNRVRTSGGLQERCLLYIDKYGRPFNITIVGGSAGLIGSWKSSLSTFSGLEATIAIAVLSRTFACSGTGKFNYFYPVEYKKYV